MSKDAKRKRTDTRKVEKRRDARVARRQRLWSEGQSEMETRDISRSGMFIVADESREVGEHLSLSFEGDDGTIELNAEVMWRGGKGEGDPVGMGVRIVSFKQGEAAYERFVRSQLQDEDGSQDD